MTPLGFDRGKFRAPFDYGETETCNDTAPDPSGPVSLVTATAFRSLHAPREERVTRRRQVSWLAGRRVPFRLPGPTGPSGINEGNARRLQLRGQPRNWSSNEGRTAFPFLRGEPRTPARSVFYSQRNK